ncbi:Zinc knuckle CX2CX4HX4C [Trema orientale]|uniref:Zinc knuckle CX2CX4HX4C n=1 Tax=Trema orientale TaxID=63057 RepID=A0A2P5F9L6_TREOI|nr:Zinc knuckle CX2CX4HX4C [Trema orientale]
MNLDKISRLCETCRTKKCKFLGKLIGVLEEAKVRDTGIRVMVQIDVNVPLCRVLRVSLEKVMKEVFLILQYERLPNFYFKCGIMGHRL